MVSKNNKIKKMEEAAERQNHFSIRKLTIGAASVLLGTTLWLGTTANVSHAETSNGEDNQTPHEATTTDQKAESIDSDTKVVVNTNGQNQSDSVEQKDESAATDSSKETTSAKTTETNAEDAVKNNNVNSSITDQNNQNKDQAKKTVINNNDTTKNAENKVTAQNNQQKVETSKSSSQNDQTTAAKQVQRNAEKVAESAASLTNAANDNKTTATTENSNAADNDYDLSAAGLKGQLATDSTLNAGQALKLAQKANAASVSVDNTKLTAEDAKKIAALYGTSLIQKNDKTTAVTDWSGVEDAYNSGESSVIVSGNIDATSDLDISRDFTIEGADKTATINLGSNTINNSANLTLKNVTINGSILGHGTVNVEGNVTSNVDSSNSKTLTSSQLNEQIGTSHTGATVDNWKSANIEAAKVNVDEGATLNVNRSITGDGIVLVDGASSFVDDGSTFGTTKQTNDKGTLDVGVNAVLNINLKDATSASRSNEQGSSIDNANSAIRANDNGHIVTGDSAKVTINAGHGRAINFGEPFGGTSTVEMNTNWALIKKWYEDRTNGSPDAVSSTNKMGYHKTDFQTSNNTITLGDSTQLTINSRDGILFGNRGTFTTGDHSIVTVNSVGNGAGLLGEAFSTVEVSPHSQLLLNSDGKDASGHWSGGNFIGLGENGQFRVEHDATFKYKLVNRGNTESNPYDDNMNIISLNTDSKPEVYVGPNATFDGESDYRDYYGEIFSFPLGSTATVFQIDGAKYVNWEKNAQVIGHDGAGNLYYSSGAGLIDATGQKYYVFKWNNKNLNDNNYTFDDSSSEAIAQSIKNFENSSDKYWTDIEHLATKYSTKGSASEWRGHHVSDSDIKSGSSYDPTDVKTGTKIGNYKSADGDNDHTTGFDPLNSQRLVLVASTIPTQDDDTSQVVTKHKVIIQEDDTLQPGQVKLVQEDKDGLSRTTTTTYYNVDPSTGKKTLDTTKGTNGNSTTTTVIDKEQDEIIHIAPQTAKVTYYENSDAAGNEISSVGDNGTVSLSGNPVATDSDGNVEFDSNGNAIANTINYRDYANDLSKATNKVAQDAGVSADKVNTISDTWSDAVKAGTNKYDVTGLTKDAIVSAAEKAGLNNTAEVGPTVGPSYKVVLKAQAKAEQGSVKVIYHDDTDNVEIPNTEYNSGEEDEGTKVSYTTEPTISDLENKGYVYVSTEGTIPSTIQGNTNTVVTVHMKHGTKPVNPDNPTDKYTKDDLQKTSTRTINYVDSEGNKIADSVTSKVVFTGQGTIDTVTGNLVDLDKNGNIVDQNGKLSWTYSVDGGASQNGTSYEFAATSERPTITYNGSTYNFTSVNPGNYNGGNGAVTSYQVDNTKNNDLTINVVYNKQAIYHAGKTDSKEVTRTINYLDGKTGQSIPSNLITNNPVTQTVNMHRTEIVDANGKVIGYGAVSQDGKSYTINDNYVIDGNWASVTSPDLSNYGYKAPRFENGASASSIAEQNVTADTQNTTVNVYYDHDTVPVNPGNPGNPGQPINPNYPDGPKYPEGTDKATIDKTITRTIHYTGAGEYTPSDVKQSTEFTASGVLDKVTGDWVTPLTWSKDQTVASVTSPRLPGYHVVSVDKDADGTNVASKTLTHNDSDYTVTVTYAKDAAKQEENANLKIIDITDNNKEIGNFNDSGDDNSSISFNGAETTIDALVKSGYKVNSIVQATSDANNPIQYGTDYASASKNWKFDDKPGVDQQFVVYLQHDYTPINPENAYGRTDLTRTVTETVHYVDEATNKQVATDATNSATFTGKGMVDKVTGKMLAIKSIENGQVTYDTNVDHEIEIASAKDSDFVWSSPVTFQKITSPSISGYTIDSAKTTPSDLADGNDIKEIDNVSYNTKNIEATVYYKANPVTPAKTQQNAKLTVIDETEDKTIANYSNTGLSGDPINFGSAESDINNFLNNGYVWDAAKTGAANYAGLNIGNFDNDSKTDQTWTVYLKHGVDHVTPDNPGHGYDKKDLDRTVTTTVNYVDQNGNKLADSVTNSQEFKGEGYFDKVTGGMVTVDKDGNITGSASDLTWTPESKSFDAIPAKSINGYTYTGYNGNADAGLTVDSKTGAVSAQTMNHKTADSIINIVYTKTPVTPVAASGSITYVDQTTGDTLESATFGGNVGDKINYTTADRIAYYEGKGYDLVSNDFKDGNETFAKDAKDNTFKVVLKHATVPVTPDKPGKPGQPVEPNNPNNPHKYPDNYVPQNLDKTVTRDVTYVYEDGSQALDPVHQSVEFKGQGTLDLVTGNLVNLNNDGSIKDQNGKITWTPETGNFNATNAIDTNTYQITKISESNTNANVDETTGVVASEQVNPTSQNSKIVITLAKKTPVTPAKDQVAQVIYRDVNDASNPVQIATSGELTGKSGSEINYSTADEIKTLTDKGYVLKNDGFPAGAVFDNDDTKDQVFYVDFVHGTTTITPDKPGKPGQPIVPTNPDGPKWPDGTDSKSLTKTGTQTVHYVYEDGSKAADDNVTNVTFDHSITYDNVTGKVVTDNGWTPSSQSYKTIISPTIKGYTPDRAYTGGETVTIDTKTGEGNIDKTYVVTYKKDKTPTPAKDQGSITVTVHDTTDNVDLPQYGKSSGTEDTGTKFEYDKNQVITDLTNKGYKVINPDVTIPSEITKGNQNVVIYVEHTTTTITPDKPGKPGEPIVPTNPDGPKWPEGTDSKSLTKTGTQTVHYVGAGEQTPKDNVTTIEFDHSITYDNVTGKVVTDNGWTPDSRTYTTITTPTIKGYTPDKTYVGGETVTIDPKTGEGNIDKTYTVTYTKDQTPTPAKATGSVTYIDDTTKSNLKVDNLAGNVGDKIDYTTAQSIKDYEDKGYELVSNNFRDGQETFAKDGNTFEVHLKHATETINPNNPGKPGEPINPNYPDGPKWGDDTDKSHLQVNGSQTIHYQGAGEQTPKDSVIDINFNHEVVIDKVTGKVIEDHGWTITDNQGKEIGKGDSYTFNTVDTPNVPGYTADKTVAGGKTVTKDNPKATDTVTYTKNSNPTQPTQPSQPTSAPSNPTNPTTPSQPTTVPVHPEQPTNAPSSPTEPTTPVTPTNIAPHPETPETTPEAQPSNVAPHGETVPVLPTNNVAPKATKVSEGKTYKVAKTAEPVQAIHANKQNASQNALPQTGEDNNEDVTAAVLGGLAASLSLIGLAGVKKRRHN